MVFTLVQSKLAETRGMDNFYLKCLSQIGFIAQPCEIIIGKLPGNLQGAVSEQTAKSTMTVFMPQTWDTECSSDFHQ